MKSNQLKQHFELSSGKSKTCFELVQQISKFTRMYNVVVFRNANNSQQLSLSNDDERNFVATNWSLIGIRFGC